MSNALIGQFLRNVKCSQKSIVDSVVFLIAFEDLSLEQKAKWSEYKDSNLGPPGPKPGALPDCATLRLRPTL